MDKLKIRQIFRRYLSGLAEEKEVEKVDSWYRKLDESEPVQLSETEERDLEHEIWKELEPHVVKRKTVLTGRVMRISKVAACIIFVSLSSLYLYRYQARVPSGKPASQAVYEEFHTTIGEKKRLSLPDGTIVTLNSGSRIRIYKDLVHERRVDLPDGEAFFEVKKDPRRPFVIHSGSLSTRVLGTSFNIRAYNALGDVSVAVVQGRVEVSDRNKVLGRLSRQEQIVFNRDDRSFVVRRTGEECTAWLEGKLAFKNIRFVDAAVLFEKNYGIHLHAADPRIAAKKITATIPVTTSAYKAAEVLASIHKLKTKQRRDTIEIYR